MSAEVLDREAAEDALELSGLALAIELVRIAADEVAIDAPSETDELRRVQARLEHHRDGVAHVDYSGGVSTVWKAA